MPAYREGHPSNWRDAGENMKKLREYRTVLNKSCIAVKSKIASAQFAVHHYAMDSRPVEGTTAYERERVPAAKPNPMLSEEQLKLCEEWARAAAAEATSLADAVARIRRSQLLADARRDVAALLEKQARIADPVQL